MVRAFGQPLQRAMIGGGLVAAVIAVVWMFVVDGTASSIPQPLVVAPIAGMAGTLVAVALVPAHVRRAYEAFSWLGRAEVDRFEARTGGPVPTRPDEFEDWLAAHPPTPAMLLPRVEILAFLGRYDAARRELADIEQAPDTAFERASLTQYIDWIETGTPGTAALRAATAPITPGTDARRVADTTVALAEARVLVEGDDPGWTVPLETARRDLGVAPLRVVLRDTWVKAGVTFTLVALIAAFGASLLRFLL